MRFALRQGVLWWLITMLSACTFVRAPIAEELALLDNPPAAIKQQQDTYAPLILDWINRTEAQLLLEGRPLTEKEVEMARKLGVVHPEQVRVIVRKTFPQPTHPQLLALPAITDLARPEVGGLTLGYAILLKPRFSKRRWILAHELMHVVQQERMGRMEFLRRYIAEHELMPGRLPLELEAHKPALEFWPL